MTEEQNPNKGDARRPFPLALFFHFVGRYVGVWVLLGAVIFIVQTVLAGVLHDREDLRSFLTLLDRMPKIIKAFIGGDELMVGNVLGVVAIGYQHPLVLLCLMLGATTIPTGLLTAEAERGTMELLLARPVTRGRIFFMASVIPLIGQIVLVHVVFLGTTIWTRVFSYGEPIPLTPFYHVVLNLAALSMAVVGLSVLAAVVFNERNVAVAVVIGYLVVSYLFDFSAVWWPRMKAIHPYSLFQYCVPNQVIRGGTVPWFNIGVLVSVMAVSLTIGLIVWRRKDLAAA